MPLAVALAAALAALLLLAPGAGAAVSFGAPANLAAGDAPFSVAVGDFNADGDIDLAVANVSSDNVSVLLGAPVRVRELAPGRYRLALLSRNRAGRKHLEVRTIKVR